MLPLASPFFHRSSRLFLSLLTVLLQMRGLGICKTVTAHGCIPPTAWLMAAPETDGTLSALKDAKRKALQGGSSHGAIYE
ncbi:hypothetical protein DFH06DRAFT_239043 [Mycena polygramma]|nr:hypothetical protein DFH06DRAFT_239043 [Mycena polygramma]